MDRESMVAVAEASDPIECGIWIDALAQAGVEARSFERGSAAALGGVSHAFPTAFRVLVPSGQVATARNVIADLAGADRLLGLRTAEEQISGAQRWTVRGAGVLLAIVLVAVIARTVAG